MHAPAGLQNVSLQQTEISPLNLSPGSEWKNFVIEKKLGTGTFGVVYRARDRVLNRIVALKFVTTQEALREGKLLAKVKDDGVVAVHSIEEEGSATAICMEFVPGIDLEKYFIKNGRQLNPMYAAVIGRSLCRSLTAVHRVGLLHRDVKPRNVIVSDGGRFVLVDFGLGMPIDSEITSKAGTPHYMAPELLEGKQPTRSTDLYALGVLLFYLVCGDYPFTGASASELLEAHKTGRRRHLADCVQVPHALAAIIERAIAPDPHQRFGSAGAMLNALDAFVTDRPVRVRRRWPVYFVVGTVTAGALLFGFRNYLNSSNNVVQQRLDSAIGLYYDPSLSNDGRILVFSSDKAGHGDLDIWVEYPATGASKALTGPGADEHQATISEDGTLVAYRSERASGAIYVNSTLGGDERLIAPYGRHPRFSPDGTRLAYWIGDEGNLRTATGKCYVVPLAGGKLVPILPRFADCRFPIWSPDGRYLLVTATEGKNTSPQDGMDWWLVPADKPGQAIKLGLYPAARSMNLRMHLYPPHWAGSKIVFAAHDEALGNIWQVKIRFHRLILPPSRLTSGTAEEGAPWNLSNGTLAFTATEPRINVWNLDLNSPHSGLSRVTSGVKFDLAPHVSADGRYILLTHLVGDQYSSWFYDTQTNEERELPLPPHCSCILSPDAQRVIYSVNNIVGQKPMLEYVVKSGTARTICTDCGTPLDFMPGSNDVVSADGDQLILVHTENGHSSPLIEHNGRPLIDASVSAAGNRIAYVSRIDAEHAQVLVASLSGNPVHANASPIAVTNEDSWSDKPRWSVDGRKLYYYSSVDGFGCVYEQSFDRNDKPVGSPQTFEHLHSARLSTSELSQPSLNLSIGGGKLFINLDEAVSSIWIQRPRNY